MIELKDFRLSAVKPFIIILLVILLFYYSKEFKIIMMEQFYKQPSEEELEQAFEFFDQGEYPYLFI